ncbi:uncharacterized protein TNCV_2902221 [Trichonephila clavipes]|nr:uncharacterized protein TNCV_2902221 [Trichonephila clavipes]
MSRSKELSEFDRGSLVGCHLCGKSVCEIADILQKLKSTEFQSSSGICVRSRTVRRELKNFGFHGRVAAPKKNITPQNAKHRLQGCRDHRHWISDMWKTVQMGVQNLDWPSQSPDLNPIELLWDELERILRSQTNLPSSLQALTSAVMDTWKAIPMVTYQKLVENLPKRVQAVIHAKGGTNIILIYASGRSNSIPQGVRILLAR